MFHRVHFVEKWGRGIDLILSEEPDAFFKEVADIFVTTFKRKNYYETADSASYVDEQEIVYEIDKKAGTQSSMKTGNQTTDKIIELIEKDPQITIKELAE
ncbi:MAG: hypothetical protein GY765_01335 [bacterium]|nr:hypothetical protein [bacterium]